MKPPSDKNDWLMLGIVAGVAGMAHILKVLSRGDPFGRATAGRHLARACLTGIVAAGVWSAITEFRELNPATAVGIAAAVAMLGVDYVERVLDKVVEKKLGVSKEAPATAEPPTPAAEPDPTPLPPLPPLPPLEVNADDEPNR